MPGWVGRFLLPEIERVVEKEVGSLRREMNARFDAVNDQLKAVHSRLDALEKRYDLVHDLAILKAEVRDLREKLAARG